MIKKEDWIPFNIELELAALDAVKEEKNILVIAGPGAGKTELLAQKACYLLETNTCKSPQRILAISFKKDSAENLKKRVTKRVGEELSQKFDSYTFDSFAKSILDRFLKGLPLNFRPTRDYEIGIDNLKNNTTIDDYLHSFRSIFDNELLLIPREKSSFIGIDKLENEGFGTSNAINKLRTEFWEKEVTKRVPSRLDFQMIQLLAELLLRENPMILKALQQTYSFVFLDEFQDTTDIQYLLLKTCFGNRKTGINAVGDSKQSIMRWAGAKKDIFNIYQSDFFAEKIELISNYRSAPNLVKIQHSIIKVLEGDAAKLTKAKNKSYDDNSGECQVFFHGNEELEANNLGQYIYSYIKEQKVEPREICILTRQTPKKYINFLENKLKKYNIRCRIETDYQEMLSEPVISIIISLINILGKSSPEDYEKIRFHLELLYGENFLKNQNLNFDKEIQLLRKLIKESPEKTITICLKITKLLNIKKIKTIYPQYTDKKYLNSILKKFCKQIIFFCKNIDNNIFNAIEEFEGLNTIPIMTLHKSKGLEFKIVIFIGLEDSALWNYIKNRNEEINGFFVAFSRAKEKIIFSYSEIRNGCRQSYKKINELYEMLKKADVPFNNYFEETKRELEDIDDCYK